MKLEVITSYAIDGQFFQTTKKAQKHIEDRIFKHIQKGTAYAGAGSEQSKMRLELMNYILQNKQDIAALLSADFNINDE